MDLDTCIFYTESLDRIIPFYESLGLTLAVRQGDRYASFRCDNGPQLGFKVADVEREVPGRQTVILRCENIREMYALAQEKGGKVYKELQDLPWGTTFSILDPDGNKVEFVRRPAAQE